jgi:hypothetical protein
LIMRGEETLTLTLAVFGPLALRPVESAPTSATTPHRSNNWRALAAMRVELFRQTRTNHDKIVKAGSESALDIRVV